MRSFSPFVFLRASIGFGCEISLHRCEAWAIRTSHPPQFHVFSVPMSELLNRFSIQAVKFNWQMLALVALIWLVVVGCVISSIFARPFSPRQRIFWITIVICLPLIGLLAYLPFSFRKEELPHVFLTKKKKSKKKHTGESAKE